MSIKWNLLVSRLAMALVRCPIVDYFTAAPIFRYRGAAARKRDHDTSFLRPVSIFIYGVFHRDFIIPPRAWSIHVIDTRVGLPPGKKYFHLCVPSISTTRRKKEPLDICISNAIGVRQLTIYENLHLVHSCKPNGLIIFKILKG